MNSSWPGSSEPRPDGGTVIEFLDDVMQDRTEGFKTHHRIAAAKELIVHIVRDEQPSQTPSPSTRETDKRGDSTAVGADPRVRPLPGSKTPSPSTGEGLPREGDSIVVPAQAGTQRGGARSTAANPARTEPVLSTAEGSAHPNPSSSVVPANTIVVPAKAGTQGGGGARSTAANSAHPEPSRRIPGQIRKTPNTTHPNTTSPGRSRQGRRSPKGSERIEEEKDEKPAPVELTPAERRIKEKLEQHWHEPDPYGAPLDSTHPGRSPPW